MEVPSLAVVSAERGLLRAVIPLERRIQVKRVKCAFADTSKSVAISGQRVPWDAESLPTRSLHGRTTLAGSPYIDQAYAIYMFDHPQGLLVRKPTTRKGC